MSTNHYRLYFLTPQNQIYRFIELECASDDEAAQEAARLLQSDPIEIWHRARLIRRLEPRAVEERLTGT